MARRSGRSEPRSDRWRFTSRVAANRLMQCFFASDLHGRLNRYGKLFAAIGSEMPDAAFLGGDLLPHGFADPDDFIESTLARSMRALRESLGERFPRVFLILGNDDPRSAETCIRRLQ